MDVRAPGMRLHAAPSKLDGAGTASYNQPRPRRMFFSKPKNPEERRYYLLPGQGRSNKRRRRQMLWWAIICGLMVSALLAGALWYFNTRR